MQQRRKHATDSCGDVLYSLASVLVIVNMLLTEAQQNSAMQSCSRCCCQRLLGTPALAAAAAGFCVVMCRSLLGRVGSGCKRASQSSSGRQQKQQQQPTAGHAP